MKSFSVGINATVVGDLNIRRLANAIKAVGGEVDELDSKILELDGVQERVATLGVKNWKKLSVADQSYLKGLVGTIGGTKRFGTSLTELDPKMEDVVKHLKKMQKEQLAAAKSAAAHADSLKKLQERLDKVRAAAQQRRDDAQKDRDTIKERDRPALERARAEKEQADLDRHNRRLQASQQNHRLAMQRISAYNSGGGLGSSFLPQGVVNGGIAKVIAYDALRRTLTNIYQIIGQIGDKVASWVVESVKLNDEMMRAQTVFTGLGLIGMKDATGGSLTIEGAEKSNKSSDRQTLAASEAASKQLMNKLVAVSLETGEDLNEVVASARQLSTDLLNKAKKPDWVKNQGTYQDVIVAMTEIGAAFKSQDPAGRKMGWHMVSIQELFSGSSGGKKDTGMQNVRSMMLREGIKIREADASSIAKAVNAGKIKEASEAIIKILDRSGTSIASLKNQQYKTLAPNVSGAQGALAQIGKEFTSPLYESLVNSFRKTFLALNLLLKDGEFMFKFVKTGQIFSEAIKPILKVMGRAIDILKDDPDRVAAGLRVLTLNFSDAVDIFLSLGKGLFNFFVGFLGIADGSRLDVTPFKQAAAQFEAYGTSAGITMRNVAQKVIDLATPITVNLIPAISDLTAGIKEVAASVESVIAAFTYIEENTRLISSIYNYVTDMIVNVFTLLGLYVRKLLSWIPGSKIDKNKLQQDWTLYDDDFNRRNMSPEKYQQWKNEGSKPNPAWMTSTDAPALRPESGRDAPKNLVDPVTKKAPAPGSRPSNLFEAIRLQVEKNKNWRDEVAKRQAENKVKGKSDGTYGPDNLKVLAAKGRDALNLGKTNQSSSSLVARPVVMPTPAPTASPSIWKSAGPDPALVARVAALQKGVKLVNGAQVPIDAKAVGKAVVMPNKPLQLTGSVSVKNEGVRIGNINVTTNDPKGFVNGLEKLGPAKPPLMTMAAMDPSFGPRR